ncbi:TonB-dependent receptor, partial [Pedobacter sp. HMWF019]|uniref:TonB-dependent receptor n=1 Tax=Pedobacter sp. HMWF019 TaxID=2056856 RepID=UPI000D3A90BB
MNKSLLFKIVVIVFAFVGVFTVAQAQVTTSSATGTIKDSKGPMPGASVKATHTPTGTTYGVTTNNDGRFTIGNMRVGGPYVIEVSFVGYKPQKIENVYLKLGEPFVLNVLLSDNASNLNEVTIVGTQRNSILNSNKNGTSTVVTRAQIQNLPTITRSVNDITRLTPQGGGPNGSLAGGSSRSNNFTVDGANFNNQFGIGANVPAGGSPISLDALEQISVNVTPYDVRQSGFTGGAINAVTRSGTNDFSGTAFYLMRNDDQQGTKVGDYTITNPQKFDQKQYGFSLGGPIVRNKLFFFVNAEWSKQISPGTANIASTAALPYGGANTPSYVARPTEDFMNTVKSYLISKYNYDPGDYQGYDNKTNNTKLLARLDWNISKDHHFNIRYNQVESRSPFSVSTSTSGSNINYTNNRTSNFALPFSNSNYFQDQNLYSGAAELTSNFGSKFTNSLRATYSHQNDPRSSNSSLFPFVDILDNKATGSVGSPLTSFGYEPFTYGNLRDVKTFTYSDDFSMALGKHNVTLGVQAEFSTTKNGFQRFGTGFYTFNSWDDFVNGARPVNYALTYPLTADGSQAYPSFKFAQYSAYLQDEFTVTSRLKLTGGVRIERATFPDVSEIKTHPMVAALTFANGEKINTGNLPQARTTFSPRFGFNWDINGDRSVQLRGGSGIFTGRIPFVWIVAQSGDAGLLQFTQTYSGNDAPYFNPNPTANIPANKPAAGTSIPSNISAMAPNLRFPQTWKSSLAVDFKMPFGIVGTVEGIYQKDLYAVVARNANLNNPTALAVSGGYADNRLIYPNALIDRQVNSIDKNGQVTKVANQAQSFNAIVMDNVKGGHYWSASVQLNKQFSQGLSLTAAYTKSGAKNYGDGGGDQILNLWSYPYNSTGNSNVPSLSATSNVIPDRVIASVSYRKEYLKNLATTISLFYEGGVQGTYSYYYSSDFNRDGQTNDLIYIPKNASDIKFLPLDIKNGNTVVKTYSPEEQAAIFDNFINNDPYLSKHRGEYAERNGAKLPWRNQVDFKLVQEVFRNVGGKKNSFQFTMDVFNFGNLLNKNWGAMKYVRNMGILTPANVSSLTTDGKGPQPTFRMATSNGDIVRDSFGVTQTIASTYYM